VLRSKHHITIHDLARELKVSASTISRALNNNPRVSIATRKKVQDLAKKYNYQPNQMAASLRKGRGNTVGVIVPNINRSFFSNIIGGLEEVLSTAGYNLMICQSHEKLEKEKESIETLLNARVDGIMMSLSMETENTEYLESVGKQLRMLFFDRVPLTDRVDSVVIDDFSASYKLVNHLAKKGYKKIAHIKGASQINVYAERTRAYLSAIENLKLQQNREWIIEEEMTIAGGERAFGKLQSLKNMPDAVLCSGDFVTLGVLNAARKSGISVPKQLGLTGFANETFTEFITPSITTVDQKGMELGRAAAELYLKRSGDNKGSSDFENIVIQPDLIFRESTMKEG
jgi:LacI family transcriptional regulator